MRIAGIIAEYNPFHRGHAYHIAETRLRSGCDYVIACMDGHFTQRGEPALYSRWNRARMALSCGVDAVFELPTLYAVRTADAFAEAGVAILGGLGADVLSFGCEAEAIPAAAALADMAEDEPESVSERIKLNLSMGMNHARARGQAVAEHLKLPEALLDSPNLILAAEYLRAIRRQRRHMEPLAIPRRGSYRDAALGEYASASAIRRAMERGEMAAALNCLPPEARPYAEPEALHPMDDLLLDRLWRMSPEAMARLPEVSEGLEHRLYRLCREAPGREALLEGLKCRRYTRARLSRMLAHALLGMGREMVEAHPQPAYARLIGMRAGAEPLLKAVKSRATLPVISNPSALRGDPVFELEVHATDMWALLHDNPARRRPGRELTEKFVYVG